ncbi:TauD/TfdA family dioxygenase, partial [Citrobacter sp. VF227]
MILRDRFCPASHAFKAPLAATRRSYLHAWTQGDMVVWDNRRIFHGRGDFGAPGIVRTLRGGYFREGELRARAGFMSVLALVGVSADMKPARSVLIIGD